MAAGRGDSRQPIRCLFTFVLAVLAPARNTVVERRKYAVRGIFVLCVSLCVKITVRMGVHSSCLPVLLYGPYND